MPGDWRAVLALLAVQGLFGSLAVVGKLVLAELPALALLAFRVVPSALLFYAAQRATVREPVAPRGDYARLAGLALLGVVLNMGMFLLGLERTTATNAVVLITSIPVFTLAIAVLLRHERLDVRKALGLALALGGVLYLLAPGFAAASRFFVGNLLVVLNSLSYASFLVLSRPLLARYDPLTVAAWTFLFAALVAAPLGAREFAAGHLAGVSPQAWLGVAYIVLFVTVAVYYLNNWALRRVPSSTVAMYIYMQPLVGAGLAFVVLDEVPTFRTLVAAVLVFAGVALATLGVRLPARALPQE